MRIILIISLLAFISCKNGQQATDGGNSGDKEVSNTAEGLFLSFERTPCFGKCPAFRMNVQHGGSATYEGIQFAPRDGKYSGKVSKAILNEILSEAERIGFFDLQEKYDGPVTDIPSMIIDIRTKDKRHKVLRGMALPRN